MAKKEQAVEVAEPTGFPMTLDEFLAEVPKAKTETKAGFRMLCKLESINGNRMKQEWQRLFGLYETKPVKINWATWHEKGGN